MIQNTVCIAREAYCVKRKSDRCKRLAAEQQFQLADWVGRIGPGQVKSMLGNNVEDNKLICRFKRHVYAVGKRRKHSAIVSDKAEIGIVEDEKHRRVRGHG